MCGASCGIPAFSAAAALRRPRSLPQALPRDAQEPIFPRHPPPLRPVRPLWPPLVLCPACFLWPRPAGRAEDKGRGERASEARLVSRERGERESEEKRERGERERGERESEERVRRE
eukprot:1061064-Rhodomonas_salina.1